MERSDGKRACPKHDVCYEENPETGKMNYCRMCDKDKTYTTKAITE